MFLPAIPQDPEYHNFADQKVYLGLINFSNVISNLPYLIFGLLGAIGFLRHPKLQLIQSLKYAYLTFFIGVSLTGFGSAYYHLNPGNDTLFWDRLPMTLAFMPFFTLLIAEYVSERGAIRLFLPLLVTGVVSVVYWYWTETQGRGDLRLYILVQFLPIILIPLILMLYQSRFTHGYYYWLIIACYVLAKIFEQADQIIFDALIYVSGHSLKHMVSALAPLFFYLMLKNRRQYSE